ncbi:MAG: electron transfer flavoprotein subunit beta/FixA family protein, partial [Myxococcota bacterium]
MKFLVATKRVEHYESKIRINGDGTGIQTDGLTYQINPFDEIALEEAVRLKDEHDAEVVVVSIGTDACIEQLRQALARGADRAILVKAEGVGDADVAAHALKAVVEAEQPNVLFMGKQAIDDDCNQTGQLVAEYLQWPQVTFAAKIESLESEAEKQKEPAIEIDDEVATVVREIDGGLETVEVDLPAVITVDLRLNKPRYPALPNIIKAKQKPLEQKTLSELGVTATPKVT